MRNAKLGLGVGALLAAVGIAAACTSNDNSGPPAGSGDGGTSSGGSSGGSSSGASSSGASSSGSSSSGASSSGASSSGASSGGGDGGITQGPTIPLPGNPGAIAYDPTANEAWVCSSAQTDAGTTLAAITIIDTVNLTVKATLTMNASSAGYGPIVFAPDLGKAYVSSQTNTDGGFGAEIDEIDVSTHAIKYVASYQSAIDGALGMAYDPNSHKVFVSVDDAHYMLVIDASTDTLLTTWPNSIAADAGLGLGFGSIVIDPTGSLLYSLNGDQNSYPMVATFPTDGGAPFDVLGGQSAGWELSTGLALVASDAGPSGITDIGLKDGGTFLQLIDPATINLVPGDTPLALWAPYDNGFVFLAVTDACGKKRLRMYDISTGFEWDNIFTLSPTSTIRNVVPIDQGAASGGTYHVLINLQPQTGGSSGGGTTTDSVTEFIINRSATTAAPCP